MACFQILASLTISVPRKCNDWLDQGKEDGKKEAEEIAMEELKRVGLRILLINTLPNCLADRSKGWYCPGSGHAAKADPLDEPTSALDPELTGEVLNVMRKLANEGMTMLIVTHEMGFARTVADELIFMEDGVILEQGPPEKLFTSPEHPRTREFLFKLTDLYNEGER